MRILLLAHAFNSLTQRVFVELSRLGHAISVELDINDKVTHEAAELFTPDLIVAPFLKRPIPDTIWKRYRCFIVHPGIRGDGGPSALDWAILDDRKTWGVTILEARENLDAGPVWATERFAMRRAAKSSLYRNEVTEAAVEALLRAIKRYELGAGPLPPAEPGDPLGIWCGPCRQSDRAIDWLRDDSAAVLRKIRSADGVPGVSDTLFGRPVYLHDARPASGLSGLPGAIVATSGPAVARATVDGAVWIGHLRDSASRLPFKLPAVTVLGEELRGLPEIPRDTEHGYQEIAYEEENHVGYLHFAFLNGAMGTDACVRLLEAYRKALTRPTKLIVLSGGPDFWSNGMDLNAIEAAKSAADESWANINAIDDLAEAILRTTSHLTVAALQGNAGAGGVFLARAADRVWLREGIVLSPHYKDMGNLYGSELWTYLLPRYVGTEHSKAIMSARLPMGAREAVECGLADDRFGNSPAAFLDIVRRRARALATSEDRERHLSRKMRELRAQEAEKPLSAFRAAELAAMRTNFYGFDPSYHVARYNFVHKIPKSRTPITLARHRDKASSMQRSHVA